MNNTLVIFIRAVCIYLLFTLPALAVFPMYLMSAFFACTYGWAAWLVFLLLYLLLKKAQLSIRRTFFVLALAVMIGVLLAFQLIEVFKGWEDIWHSGTLLSFPVIAVLSGWISLYASKEDIKLEFIITDSPKEEKENQ